MMTKEFFIKNCKVRQLEDGTFVRWSNRAKDYIPLKLTPNTTKHPYGTNKTYMFINLYDADAKRCYGIPYHRFIWIWTYGDIPDKYDIHHIDGDSTNNDIRNLAVISRKENLKERRGKKNQYR